MVEQADVSVSAGNTKIEGWGCPQFHLNRLHHSVGFSVMPRRAFCPRDKQNERTSRGE
jgi:hypothetical protein